MDVVGLLYRSPVTPLHFYADVVGLDSQVATLQNGDSIYEVCKIAEFLPAGNQSSNADQSL